MPLTVGQGVGMVLAVLAISGIALASSSTAVIHACVNKKTRVLTLAKGTRCGHGLSAVSWGVQGPPGAKGSPGTTGAKGAQGSPGTNGANGANGTNGNPGAPGLSASGSESVDDDSSPAVISPTPTDTVLMTAHITTTGPSEIEGSGGAEFAYTGTGSTSADEVDCGLAIAPSGGSAVAMGNRYQVDFSNDVAYNEPGSAGGALQEPAGSYTVTFGCHQIITNGGLLAFRHGDLNLVAAAPSAP